MSSPLADYLVTSMPLEGRPITPPDAAEGGAKIIHSAFHTVADIMRPTGVSTRTHGFGVDSSGIYADFNAQYAQRPATEMGLSISRKITVAFELYSSGDGIVCETDTTYVNHDGLQIYHENSTGKFYVGTSTAGGLFCQKSAPLGTTGVWRSWVCLIDRDLGATQAVNQIWQDGISLTLTNVSVTGTSGGFNEILMNFMSRNAGASLKLTGRLRNFHIAAGWWTPATIVDFYRNPYFLFSPEPALYPKRPAAGGGSTGKSNWWLAA